MIGSALRGASTVEPMTVLIDPDFNPVPSLDRQITATVAVSPEGVDPGALAIFVLNLVVLAAIAFRINRRRTHLARLSAQTK